MWLSEPPKTHWNSLHGFRTVFRSSRKKLSPIDNQNPLPIFLNPSLYSVVSIKSKNNIYASEYNSDKMAKTTCSIFVNNILLFYMCWVEPDKRNR